MNEQVNSAGATGASTDSALLNVLIGKTVDNGTAIRETQELIRKMSPDAVVAGLEQRLGALEGEVTEAGKATNQRIAGLQGTVEVVGSEVAKIGLEVAGPGSRIVAQMGALQDSMEKYVGFFKGPTTKEVHHRHILGPAIWVVVIMGAMIVLLSLACVTFWNRLDRFEKSDWLWRGALLSEDSTVTRAQDTLKRNYNADPEQFKKDVDVEEERRAELAEHVFQEEKERQKVEALQGSKKKPR